MRGRLIFAFRADIRRIDAGAVQADIDPDFKEPRLVDQNDDGVPDGQRPELPVVSVPCQLEPKTFDDLQMMAAGNSPRNDLTLVFHFRDLERLGLIDRATGTPGIANGDRLDAIRTRRGVLVQRIPTRPGLYATELTQRGFGLGRTPKRNLLMARFSSRPTATRRTA